MNVVCSKPVQHRRLQLAAPATLSSFTSDLLILITGLRLSEHQCPFSLMQEESLSAFYSIMVSATRSVSIAAGTALALLALASPRSQKARFWLNVILYVSSLGICSFWGVVVSLIMAVIPGQRLNINYVVARSFYGLCGTLTGIKFVVEGEENFKKGHPAVLIGNHQSSIDILYLGRIFPKLASIMAKKELKFAPLLGQFMLFSGAVFVNRQSRTDAVKAFDHVGATMKRRGVSSARPFRTTVM